jgi:hypothetical protein
MAQGFKIADAYVEIRGEIDRNQIRAAARLAADESGSHFVRAARTVAQRGGRDGAAGFWTGFAAAALRPSPGVLSALRTGIPGILASPVGLAGVVAGGAFVASFVSAVISSASLGLVGAAIIGLGALGVKNAVEVRTAWSETGAAIKASFADAARSMIPHFITSAEEVRKGFVSRIAPALAEMFGAAGPSVPGITRSILGAVGEFADRVAPNMVRLMPTLERMAEALPLLAIGAADFVNTMIDNGPEIAEGFENLLAVSSSLLIVGADLVVVFTRLWNTFVNGITGFARTPIGEFFGKGGVAGLISEALGGPTLAGAFVPTGHVFKKIADEIVPNLTLVSDAAGLTGMKMDQAALAAGGLDAALRLLNGGTLSARDAERAFQAAIDDANDSVATHGKTLDVNTAAGRANQAALDAVARTAQTAADAEFRLTGDTDAATQKLWDGREAAIAIGRSMGLSAKDAEALADEIILIPTEWSTEYKNNLRAQAGPIAAYIRQIEGIPKSKTVTITTQFVNQFLADQFGVNAATIGNRYGGLYMAAEGLLSTSRMFSAGNRTLFGFREPATGGEAFIAKNAPRDRSLDIAAQAAAWHGAAVVPNEQRISAPPSIRLHATIPIQIGDEVVRVVHRELDEHDQDLIRAYDMGVGAAM